MHAHIRWTIQNIYPAGCCCHLACHSQFEVDWQIHPSSHFIGFGSRQSQICQFGPGRDQKNKKKESFHLNRIILRLGILRWGRWKTLSGSFNKGCEWQTYMTVGGWQNISFWFFTGELWNKQQAEKLNYKAKKAKKAMSMTWPRARGRRGIIAHRSCSMWEQSVKALWVTWKAQCVSQSFLVSHLISCLSSAVWQSVAPVCFFRNTIKCC